MLQCGVATFLMCRFLPGLLVFYLLLAGGVAEEKNSSPAASEANDGTAHFLQQRKEAQRAFWVERMAGERKWLAQTLGLGPEQEDALARFSEEAVKKAVAEWAAAAGQMVADFQQDKLPGDEPPLVVLLGSWNSAVASRVFGQYRAPADQPAWRDGLAALLTPAQTEVWKKQAPVRLAAQLKPFLKQAKELEEDYSESAGAVLEIETKVLANTYELSEEQEEKISALSERLVKRRLAEWRQEAARCLADQPPEPEEGALADDICVPEPRPVTAHEPGWIGGLAKILDAPTHQALAKLLKEKEARRFKVLAQMLVLVVDEEARCTARQREQLLPLAERWVQAKPDLFQDQNRDELTKANFLAAAARATPEELTALFDEPQIRTWHRVCVPGVLDEMGTLVLRPPRAAAPAEPKPAEVPAGRDSESVMQAFLVRNEAKVRARCLTRALGCAEEFRRVCAPPEATRTLLQIAARGAVEATLREWRHAAEAEVREQLEAVEEPNTETLSAQLEQLEDSVNEISTPPDEQPLWVNTVKRVMKDLPAEKTQAWDQAVSARLEFARKAAVRFALEDFNRVIYLTSEQMPKVEALLEEAVKSHAEELDGRGRRDLPWYLSTPQNLTPFNFIPVAKLRGLLTARQWSGWSKSDGFVEMERR